MFRSFKYLMLISLLALSTNFRVALCQESRLLDDILEQLEDEEADEADWLEYLWELRENPLDLNRASVGELTRIPFISPALATKIVAYRKKVSKFSKLSELHKVELMNDELFEAISPFVTVKKPSQRPKAFYRLRLKHETPRRRGFTENAYSNPVYMQHRLLVQVNPEISTGFLMEKDAGETDYLDYRSFYLRYRNSAMSVVAGDYQMKIGTGLLMCTGYGLPLSPAALPMLAMTGEPASENKSFSEFNFLRGISLSYTYRQRTALHLFYSTRNLDATLSDDGIYVSSFYTSGLHRTATEKSKSGIFHRNLMGISLQRRYESFQVESAIFHTRSNLNYRELPKQQNHFSLSYSAILGSIRPAGEIALFQSKFAAFQQYLYLVTKNLKYEIAGYYYHPGYFSPWGKSFGAFSKLPQNQLGASFLVQCRLYRSTILGGYFHYYRKVRSTEENPEFRQDYLVELTQKFSGQRINLQVRQKYRDNTLINTSQLQKSITALRITHYFELNKKIDFQNRLEVHWAKPLAFNKSYRGISMFHQVRWQVSRALRLTTRWTSFDVPDYDLRIYEYQPDLPGSFSSVLLQDRGIKWILLVRWKPFKRLQCDFFYQQRYYPDLLTVGSGRDEFSANRIHNLKLSVIWRY